ncbi:hypothetical protein RM553_06620 [Zunongwangia sp. F363]|uniref:Glycosyl transferase family 1 domain-containing protein n=1 Tax=Autumnicola tepida TaxID=3075595 RepID=A0ABU3C836_9FLAO|nr:hypothetical protein [Zunongwangia sp. F363]MDT0642503.1 hypothetical protein [Zunongwangia sp. F363]
MRLLFICPGMEPGKDGVGDYVSRLAFNLSKEGFTSGVIALNDRFVPEIKIEERTDDNIKYYVLRIPSGCNSGQKISTAEEWINSFSPEWVSLQYVGFGFNKYGLPLELLNLRKTLGNYHFHLMFHELWCGAAKESKIKERILGSLQKIFIRKLSATLNPREVFTNTQTSLQNLRKIGVQSKLTPVFSNIPTDKRGSDEQWNRILEDKCLRQVTDKKEDWLILGFFGTVYRYMDIEGLLISATKAATGLGKQIGILSIGHGRGQEIGKMAKNINAAYWQTGALDASLINRAMALVNLGVVTTRIDGLDKSGSAIAWLERGIPVVISSEDSMYKKEMEAKGVFQIFDKEDIYKSLSASGNFKNENRFEEAKKAYISLAKLPYPIT